MDTIHSDVFFIGTKYPLGHVTFFPNYNKTQPGCPEFKLESFFDILNSKNWTKNFISSFDFFLSFLDFCNHLYAIRFYVQTLKPGGSKLFPSSRCNNWSSYVRGNCDRNSKNYLGVNADPNTPGTFYLNTKSSQYFSGVEFYNWILSRIGDRVVNILNFDI